MMDAVFDEKMLVETVKRLSPSDQQRVIDFANQLARPKGMPGYKLIELADQLNFSKEDLAEMEAAIRELDEISDDEDVDFDAAFSS